MSLFNTLQTSVSGMAAQSNALSVIGDNIANSSTTGYKEAQAQFETVLGASGGGEYNSGGVKTDIRYAVTTAGTPVTTTSATDLAINGNGFFVVGKSGDTAQYLTRAGSFVADSSGNLVNSAGYSLQGYKVGTNGTASQLSTVNVSSSGLTAAASTAGTLSLNLNSASTVQSANLPSANTSSSTYTYKTSVTAYDKLGGAQVYDVYMTMTAGPTTAVAASSGPPAVSAKAATSGTWEASAYPQSDATNGGFPYKNAAGSNDVAATTSLTFDTNGKAVAGSSTTLSIPVANSNTVAIDMSQSTQLTAASAVEAQTMDGNAASALKSITIAKDGTVNAVYNSGATSAIYKIPLANVQSPDNLTTINGNVYQANSDSGPTVISAAGTGSVGNINSNSLEQSNADLATELTNMITAQRSYEANSKVLQAASTLLGNLNQIQTN